MKITTFLQTAKDFQEQQILIRFTEGIITHATTHNLSYEIGYNLNEKYSSCDVAVMVGSWKPREKGHHVVRSEIANSATTFICIETPLLNRQVYENNSYYRIGINGFLNNQGIFLDPLKTYDSARLEKMSVSWQGWQFDQSGHILILLQLPGDASLRGMNIYQWAENIIESIRLHTNKKIIIRPHPLAPLRTGEEFYDFFFRIHKKNPSNIEFINSIEISLQENLKGAYCSVSCSSGSAIDSILCGIPTVVTDPGSFCFDISSHHPEDINNIKIATDIEVRNLLTKLSYSQWSVDEMSEGIVWQHILPSLKNIQNSLPMLDEIKKKKK